MSLPTCRACGSPSIAVTAGTDPETAPGGIVIRRGTPDIGWCLDHWPTLRGHQASNSDAAPITDHHLRGMNAP